MHIRLRSRISVRHTTRESMLNPRPARIPETRDSTPGSFCTRQFSTCLEEMGEGEEESVFFFSLGRYVSHSREKDCRWQVMISLLFVRLQARWGRVIEDIRHCLFCRSRPRQVHLGKRRGDHFVRRLVIECGCRIIDGTWRLWRLIGSTARRRGEPTRG